MATYNFIDITGNIYGSLTVQRKSITKSKRTMWDCICECGTTKTIRGEHLKNGKIKSCGCKTSNLLSSHGKSKSSAYNVWQNMKDRCHNKNNAHFSNYGGRGIFVCDSWLNSFENFFADMGEPEKGMTIDRINNDKGYSKENCKWSSRKDQVCNRRNNINLTHKGQTKCLKDWCREFNKPYGTAMYHYKKGKNFAEIFGIE